MTIPSLFWVKFRRFCAIHLGDGTDALTQLDRLAAHPSALSPEERDRILGMLFSQLGSLPNPVERGFLIGTQMPVTAYGAASLGMLAAPTIGDTLQFIADIGRTALPLVDFHYAAGTFEGSLTVRFRHPIDCEAEVLIVALCIAAIEFELARRSGRIGNFSRLELTPCSSGTEPIYRNWLGRVPSTNAASNTLVFTRSVLDLPNTYADRETFERIRDALM